MILKFWNDTKWSLHIWKNCINACKRDKTGSCWFKINVKLTKHEDKKKSIQVDDGAGGQKLEREKRKQKTNIINFDNKTKGRG